MTTPNPQSRNTPKIYPDYCHSLSPTISRWCPLRAIDVHALQSKGMYVDGKEIYHYNQHPIKWARITGVIVAIDDFPERKILTIDDSSGACIECMCAVPPSAPSSSTATAPIPNHLDQFQVRVTAPSKTKSNSAVGSKPTVEQTNKEQDKEAKSAKNAADRKLQAEIPGQPSTRNPQIPWEVLDIGAVVKIKGQVGKRWEVKHIEVIKIDMIRGTELEVKCWDEMLSFRRDILSKAWVVTAVEEEKCRRDKEKALRHSRRRDRVAKGGSSKREEGEEDRKQRKREERKRGLERQDEMEKEKTTKRRREGEERLDPKDKVNYPSMAARRRAAGKYDTLGI